MERINKKKNWVKKRHNFTFNLVKFFFRGYAKRKYGCTYTPFDTKGQAYLILTNHQTGLDQFIVQLPFEEYCYPVASEDIFSTFFGKIMSWAVAPIPLVKGQVNVRTILTCKQVANQNKSIVLHPEGNRTYSGKTEHIAPAVAKLAKVLNLPVAFLVLRGGYGVRPRWSSKPRKGKMHVSVESVLTPEEYSIMTDQQLYQEICQRLYVNESVDDGQIYTGKNLAEYLERAIYYCPNCGISHFVSKGNDLTCTKCGMTATYLPNKQFCTADGTPPPFKNVNDWYEAQRKFVTTFCPDQTSSALTLDNVKISRVVLMKKKYQLTKKATITLYSNKLKVSSKKYNFERSFDDEVISVSVLGQNKLNVIFKEDILQFEGNHSFNALKYANFFYRYKNFKEGINDFSQFLGL